MSFFYILQCVGALIAIIFIVGTLKCYFDEKAYEREMKFQKAHEPETKPITREDEVIKFEMPETIKRRTNVERRIDAISRTFLDPLPKWVVLMDEEYSLFRENNHANAVHTPNGTINITSFSKYDRAQILERLEKLEASVVRHANSP